MKRDLGSKDLLCFEQVRREFGAVEQAHLRMQSVPVSRIVGSIGHPEDFDGVFLPSKGRLRERWQGINRTLRQSGRLPPVSLYKTGEAYFVLDGNHRVRALGVVGDAWLWSAGSVPADETARTRARSSGCRSFHRSTTSSSSRICLSSAGARSGRPASSTLTTSIRRVRSTVVTTRNCVGPASRSSSKACSTSLERDCLESPDGR